MTSILLSWGPALTWAAALFILSAQSSPPVPSFLPFGDKVGHFLLYLVLGGTLAWAGRNVKGWGPHLGLMALGWLFALSDEWHQAFVPRRTPEAGDLLADVLGVMLGYLLLFTLLRYVFSNRRSQP